MLPIAWRKTASLLGRGAGVLRVRQFILLVGDFNPLGEPCGVFIPLYHGESKISPSAGITELNEYQVKISTWPRIHSKNKITYESKTKFILKLKQKQNERERGTNKETQSRRLIIAHI